NKPKLSGSEDFDMLNHYTADKSLVCSTPLPPLEKLTGAEPISEPKTVKSILKSKSTFKDETLKGIIINEPSSAPVREKLTGAEPVSRPKTVKSILKSKSTFKDESLKGIIINEPSSAPIRGDKSSSASKITQLLLYHNGQSESSSRSRPSRPAMTFPSCIHYVYNDHQSDDCIYYTICKICRSYDHNTHGHNRIISLRKGIKPRNPQHITKNCETCGSNVHATSNQNDRKREALQAMKAEFFKARKIESSNALRSKTPIKRWGFKQN
nr:hypothetical protein [Tanacetum cinerariifolium]